MVEGHLTPCAAPVVSRRDRRGKRDAEKISVVFPELPEVRNSSAGCAPKVAPKVRHDPSRRSLGPVHIAGADQRWKRSEARVAQAMEIGLPASLVTSSEMDDVKF